MTCCLNAHVKKSFMIEDTHVGNHWQAKHVEHKTRTGCKDLFPVAAAQDVCVLVDDGRDETLDRHELQDKSAS